MSIPQELLDKLVFGALLAEAAAKGEEKHDLHEFHFGYFIGLRDGAEYEKTNELTKGMKLLCNLVEKTNKNIKNSKKEER